MPFRLDTRPPRGPFKDRRGVTAAEYAVLAVGVIVAVGGAVTFLNDPVHGIFVAAGNALTSTLDALRASGSASLPLDTVVVTADRLLVSGHDQPL